MSALHVLQQKASHLGSAAALSVSVWQAGQMQSKKYWELSFFCLSATPIRLSWGPGERSPIVTAHIKRVKAYSTEELGTVTMWPKWWNWVGLWLSDRQWGSALSYHLKRTTHGWEWTSFQAAGAGRRSSWEDRQCTVFSIERHGSLSSIGLFIMVRRPFSLAWGCIAFSRKNTGGVGGTGPVPAHSCPLILFRWRRAGQWKERLAHHSSAQSLVLFWSAVLPGWWRQC